MNGLIDLYNCSPTATEWEIQNNPDADLLWRAGVINQCGRARSMATLLELKEEPRVISTHKSKSVGLPVIAFRKTTCKNWSVDTIAIFRDNFADLCCQVVSSRIMKMSLYDLYRHRTVEEIEKERLRALEYHSKTSKYRHSCGPESDAREEKYNENLNTPGNLDWYSNWSSGELLRGDRLGHIFTIHKGWYEGFPCGGGYRDRKYYTEPSKDFSFLAHSYGHMTHVFNLAFWAAENDFYEEENKKYEEERAKKKAAESS